MMMALRHESCFMVSPSLMRKARWGLISQQISKAGVTTQKARHEAGLLFSLAKDAFRKSVFRA